MTSAECFEQASLLCQQNGFCVFHYGCFFKLYLLDGFVSISILSFICFYN